jgi:hypothetical protein
MAITSLCGLAHKAAITTTAALALTTLTGPATADADVSNNVAVCHSTDVSGVETDDCVGNPAADNAPDQSWNQVLVRPRLWVGLGIG